MVKKLVTVVVAVLVLAGAAMSAARAESGVTFGYVDTRKLMTESKPGKNARADLEKVMKAKQAEIEKSEKTLKDMQAAFEKDKLILTADQKQARQKEFQEKLAAYQKMKGEAQRELQQKDQEYTRTALAEIQKIVAEIAKEKNIVLVFDVRERAVLYSAPGPDLTDDVMKKYNAQAK
jgi:outer membrane protein